MIDGKTLIFRLAAKICIEEDGHYGKIQYNIKKIAEYCDVNLSDGEINDMVDKYMPTKNQLEAVRLIEKNLNVTCHKVDRYHVGAFIERYKEKSIKAERKRRNNVRSRNERTEVGRGTAKDAQRTDDRTSGEETDSGEPMFLNKSRGKRGCATINT